MVEFTPIEETPSLANDSLPYLAVLILVAFGGVYHWQGWLATLDIALPLIPLFVLARQSDNQITPVLVLAAGLFKDILSGTPFGFWGLLFSLFYFLIQSARHMLAAQEYREQWLFFATNTAIIYMAGYVAATFHEGITPAPLGVFLSAIITALLYPFIMAFFEDEPRIRTDI